MKSIKAMPSRYEARVVLHAPAAEMRKKLRNGWGSIAPLDDETCEYRAGDDNLDWLAMRVAMLGVEFEVREPPELAEHLAALGARATRAAEGAAPGR
jgi:predicted DNA-binding transcriptional regulator YafY